MSRTAIDLNVDIGEGFGRYRIGDDEEVIKHATSANLATGFHAGDPSIMWATVMYAKKYGVAVGAHPAFQDLRGFGRRRIKMDPSELEADVLYQIGALSAFLKAEGMKMQHVKPHGALYVMAEEDDSYAEAIARAVHAFDPELIVIVEENTRLWKRAKDAGLRVAAEAFPDLNYDSEGKIVLERAKKSWDPDLVAKRALRIVKAGEIESIDGKIIKISADTLCIHSDAPNSPEIIKKVREELRENGVEVKRLSEILG